MNIILSNVVTYGLVDNNDNVLKTTLKILAIIVSVALGLALVVLLSPFLIPFYIYMYFQERRFKEEYNQYLQTIEGKRIFCYNSRTNSHSYIKNNLLPLLSSDIEIVYLNGKDPITKLEKKYISRALHSVNDRKGFPYLLKIENGKLIDRSINAEFYNTMNQNKDLNLLAERISSFYQTSN